MARVIVVTSGKGGVGKTTTSASIATGLALKGYKTVAIDFDVGLRNLDLICGCEKRVVYDFINVINGEASLNRALICDKHVPDNKLYILAASQTKDKNALTKEGVGKVINELKSMNFDFIICDSPAGIENGAQMAMYYADESIVVTNPEISSVSDSDRILGLLSSMTERAEKNLAPVETYLLITRYSPERVETGGMLGISDLEDVLRIKTIGVIPESQDVIIASNEGNPVILNDKSDAAEAYKDAVERLTDNPNLPLRFTSIEKVGFFKKLFGGKK